MVEKSWYIIVWYLACCYVALVPPECKTPRTCSRLPTSSLACIPIAYLSVFCAHLLGKLGVASSEGRCNLSKLTYSPRLILFTSRLTRVGAQVIRGESVDPRTGAPTSMLAVAGWRWWCFLCLLDLMPLRPVRCETCDTREMRGLIVS